MESLTLETIPASPSPTRNTFADTAPQPPSHSRSSSNEESPSRIFALTTRDVSSPRNSVVLTSKLVIPSTNCLRKQKMDRLRKKLGSGVPLDLVFPKETDTDRSENTPPALSTNLDKECPPLPAPTPRATKKSTGRIASSRDSISDSASIHRARRQAHTSSAAKQSLKHKKSRPSPAAPPLPHSDFKRVKERLSFIIESPDEHGSSCSEEFSLSRVSTAETDVTSGWFVSSLDTEINFWSTRKGYEGWNSTLANLSPISTFALPSDDDSSSIDPVSPASSASPVSPTSAEPSPITEVKRRPASYRKPPPPIPADIC